MADIELYKEYVARRMEQTAQHKRRKWWKKKQVRTSQKGGWGGYNKLEDTIGELKDQVQFFNTKL